jgi:hypothetical protein
MRCLWVLLLLAAAPLPAASFRFTATADSRMMYSNFAHVLSEINARVGGPGDFHITAGDTDDESGNWAELVNAFGAGVTWYPVVGNHDIESAANLEFLRARGALLPDLVRPGPPGTSLTAYSFDHGNAHFVVTNPYFDGTAETGLDGDVEDVQYAWLVNDLDSNRKPIVFVLGHEPAYPLVRHIGDSLDQYPAHRDRFWQLLEQRNVAAFIVGHTHVHSVTQLTAGKTWQIDLGNAGNDTNGEGFTFLDATVSDCTVRYDIWRGASSGAMTLHWTRTADFPPCPTATPEVPTGDLSVGFNVAAPPTASVPIRFNARLASRAALHIHNSAGERVRTLYEGEVAAGQTVLLDWDLRNRDGDRVASGLYVIHLSIPSGPRTARLLVVH